MHLRSVSGCGYGIVWVSSSNFYPFVKNFSLFRQISFETVWRILHQAKADIVDLNIGDRSCVFVAVLCAE